MSHQIKRAPLGLALNFFKLHVTDVRLMEAFYRNTFGFELDHRFDTDEITELIMSLPGEDIKLVLLHRKDGREITVGNGHGPVGFLCDDARGAYERALANRATHHMGPIDMDGGCIAFVKDPEGHEVEFVKPSPSIPVSKA